MSKDRMRNKLAALVAQASVEVTKLPPGKAQGADDLMNWSRRRAVGRSGVITEVKVWLRCEVCRTTHPTKVASSRSVKIDLFRFCKRCGRQRRMWLVRSKVIK
jgi:hypothetical protein